MAEHGARVRRGRVSRDYQFVIPAATLRAAGFAPGGGARIELERQGRIVVTRDEDVIDRYSGALATGGTLRSCVEAMRDGW